MVQRSLNVFLNTERSKNKYGIDEFWFTAVVHGEPIFYRYQYYVTLDDDYEKLVSTSKRLFLVVKPEDFPFQVTIKVTDAYGNVVKETFWYEK